MYNNTTVRRAAAVACAVLALAACGREGSSDNAAGTKTKKFEIGFAMSTLNNPFFVEMRDGARAAADKAGVKITFTDARDDTAVQADQVQGFQSQGLDGVILNAVDSDAAGAIVKPLNAAKMPVVGVDRAVIGADVDSFIASDNVAGGKLAADALAKSIGEKGKVLVLQGVAGTSASRDRGKGFTEGIAAYPGITVVAKQPADFDRTKGLDVATNLLQANSDAVGIFAENDEMALGAIKALGSRAGKSVMVVGFDATPDGVTAIKNGTMYASVAQQPAELGAKTVETLLRVLNGQDVETDQSLPVVLVDASSAS
jgi:ribose transport system substrate-binding protein